MRSQMRNVLDNRETNQQSRKDGQELVEGHAPTLTEDIIIPRFAHGPEKQLRHRKTTERPEVGHRITHNNSLGLNVKPPGGPSICNRIQFPFGRVPHP
jgi:hypothetical protein